MAQRTRTFVALPIPADRIDRLGQFQARLAPQWPGVRWIEPKLLHVTLAFLGDVDTLDLATVCRAVAESAAAWPPFTLELEGLGVFPNPARPRVVWFGLTGPGLDVLLPLQQAVTEAVARAGYPVDDDRFHPHVTLGRIKVGRGPAFDATPILARHQTWSAGSLATSEVVTYASRLGPDGPEYNPLARAPLNGKISAGPP